MRPGPYYVLGLLAWVVATVCLAQVGGGSPGDEAARLQLATASVTLTIAGAALVIVGALYHSREEVKRR